LKVQFSSNEKEDKKLIQDIMAYFKPEELEFCKLDVGDINVGPLCIELKTAPDFLSSLKVEVGATIPRIIRQVNNMQQFPIPIIIISATVPEIVLHSRSFISDKNHWNTEKLWGYMASIHARYKVPIVPFGSFGLPYFIKSLIIKSNDNKSPIINVLKAHASSSDEQEAILQSIADIGPKTASALLSRFGTISAVMNAFPSELSEVTGIGMPTALKIHELIHRKYKK